MRNVDFCPEPSIADDPSRVIPSPENWQESYVQAGLLLQPIAYPEDPDYLRHYLAGLRQSHAILLEENRALKQRLAALQAEVLPATDWLDDLSHFETDGGSV